MEDIKEYCKQLDELLAKGLYIDEAEAVIEGKCSLEEALENHRAPDLKEDFEDNDADIETYEDAENLMNIVREITAKEAE